MRRARRSRQPRRAARCVRCVPDGANTRSRPSCSMSFDAADPNIPPTPRSWPGVQRLHPPLPRKQRASQRRRSPAGRRRLRARRVRLRRELALPGERQVQRAAEDIYELVLAAQAAAVAAVKPGNRWDEPHNTAVNALHEGSSTLALQRNGRTGDRNEDYKRFYMHRTGQLLVWTFTMREYKSGGEWRRLEPGMTLTVEPGCYVRPADNVPRRSGTSACASKTMWRLPPKGARY